MQTRRFAHLIRPKIRHRIYENTVHVTACPCPPLDQSSPRNPFYFSKMHFKFIFAAIPAPSKWSVCLQFPHTSSVFTHTLLIRTTCTAYLILLYLITRNLCDEQQKLCSFSFCYLLHSALTSSSSGPHIFPHFHVTKINDTHVLKPAGYCENLFFKVQKFSTKRYGNKFLKLINTVNHQTNLYNLRVHFKGHVHARRNVM